MFGAGGLLYVPTDDSLLRYDVSDGEFLGVVGTHPGASAGSYTGVTAGSDAGIYTLSYNGVWRWDVNAGTAAQVVAFGPEVPYAPAGVVVGDDGHIYLMSGDTLLAYDAETGQFLGAIGTEPGASAGSYTGLVGGVRDNIYSLAPTGIWLWNLGGGSARELVTFGTEIAVAPAGFVLIPNAN